MNKVDLFKTIFKNSFNGSIDLIFECDKENVKEEAIEFLLRSTRNKNDRQNSLKILLLDSLTGKASSSNQQYNWLEKHKEDDIETIDFLSYYNFLIGNVDLAVSYAQTCLEYIDIIGFQPLFSYITLANYFFSNYKELDNRSSNILGLAYLNKALEIIEKNNLAYLKNIVLIEKIKRDNLKKKEQIKLLQEIIASPHINENFLKWCYNLLSQTYTKFEDFSKLINDFKNDKRIISERTLVLGAIFYHIANSIKIYNKEMSEKYYLDALSQNNYLAALDLGNLYIDEHKYDKADNILRSYASKDPECYASLGRLYCNKNSNLFNLRKAKAYLLKAIEFNSQDQFALYDLAFIYYLEGDYVTANKYFSQSAENSCLEAFYGLSLTDRYIKNNNPKVFQIYQQLIISKGNNSSQFDQAKIIISKHSKLNHLNGSDKIINILTSSLNNYIYNRQINAAGNDYSSCVVLLSKALEIFLKNYVIKSYILYLNNKKIPFNQRIKMLQTEDLNKRIIFTLNNFNEMAYLDSKTAKLNQTFINYFEDNFKLSYKDACKIITEIANKINQIKFIRNNATHTKETKQREAEECLDIAIFNKGIIPTFVKLMTK